MIEPGRLARAEALTYLKGRNIQQPYVAVAPGAGTIYKLWPESNCWDLYRRIRQELHVPVVALLGPQETGRGMVAPADAADFVCRDWSITDTAAVIAGSSMYIGQDSGVSHLAVWLAPMNGNRVPCVLTFCRLNVRAWGTLRDWVDTIPVPCATPYDVTVDQVFERVRAGLHV
jgi:hypothetical protein